MIKTGYRRFDIWLCTMENGIDPHYCVIISNYKMNIKSDELNMCQISSKLKKLPSHVDIIGFGLEKPSQIKCEKLLTKNKSQLIKKVGNITDISLQIKIEKALQMQLELNVNYSSFNTLDLENLFVDNSKIKSDKVVLEKLKSQLYDAYMKRELKEAIIVAHELKELATISKYQNAKEYIQYSLYIKASCNLGLKNLDMSLIDIQDSLRYISNPSDYSSQYSLSLWCMASICKQMGKVNEGCQIYKALGRHYKNNYESLMRCASLFNLAIANENFKAMNNIYKILEKTECTNRSIYNREEYKQELLLDMRNELNAFGI